MMPPYDPADALMVLVDLINPSSLRAGECERLLVMVADLRTGCESTADKVVGLSLFESELNKQVERLRWRASKHVPGQVGLFGEEVLEPV